MEKVKALETRIWYMQAIVAQGWSRDILLHMIDGPGARTPGQGNTQF
jgi:hypothetical protein